MPLPPTYTNTNPTLSEEERENGRKKRNRKYVRASWKLRKDVSSVCKKTTKNKPILCALSLQSLE